jgi:hypothetical protein
VGGGPRGQQFSATESMVLSCILLLLIYCHLLSSSPAEQLSVSTALGTVALSVARPDTVAGRKLAKLAKLAHVSESKELPHIRGAL